MFSLFASLALAATPVHVVGDDATVTVHPWGGSFADDRVLCTSVPCDAELPDGKYVAWIDGGERRVLKARGESLHLEARVLPPPPKKKVVAARLTGAIGSSVGLGLLMISSPLGFPLALTIPAVAVSGVGLAGVLATPKLSHLAPVRGGE